MGVLRGERSSSCCPRGGRVSFAELSDPIRLPLDYIFSDVSDRPWVSAALAAEAEGAPLGLPPQVDPEPDRSRCPSPQRQCTRTGPEPRMANRRSAISYHRVDAARKSRLRIRNLAKAVLVSGQAYQDPKDALNEFVSNAADEYAEQIERGTHSDRTAAQGTVPAIIVDDVGRDGRERLREVARSLFESSKVGISNPWREGDRHACLSTARTACTWCLVRRTVRRRGLAARAREGHSHSRAGAASSSAGAGTTVYLSDIDPDVLRVLTQRKVVDYLRSDGPGIGARRL